MSETAPPPPLWRRAAHESHLWTAVSMVVVGLGHLFLPDELAALRSPEITGWTIVALAVVLYVAHSRLGQEAEKILRTSSLVLLGLVTLTNFVSLGLLVRDIVSRGSLSPGDLLLGGVIVWLTNVVAFGFLFWEFDRGGPYRRSHGTDDTLPDLQFPQMTDPKYSEQFRPEFVDYVYVALTNAFAFSPTDTMPMSRPMKMLFALESVVSFGTIAVVAARAVNVLPS